MTARRIEFLDHYIQAMQEAQAKGRRRSRLFRLVAAGQFRVGLRLPPDLRPRQGGFQ